VLDLRRAGYDYARIAAHVGVSMMTAYRDVVAAMHEVGREQARELLQLELERLNDLQAAIYPAAVEGDIKAIDCCLTLMDRRARLVGLYEWPIRGSR
jgi:predicted GNAT superfamily acetyltransferase